MKLFSEKTTSLVKLSCAKQGLKLYLGNRTVGSVEQRRNEDCFGLMFGG
jgi:hypothetical protein